MVRVSTAYTDMDSMHLELTSLAGWQLSGIDISKTVTTFTSLGFLFFDAITES